MRITTKGQVTIPKPIRDKAKITTATELDIFWRDGQVIIEKVDNSDAVKRRKQREFDEWLERVKGTGDSGLTADEIMEMTRGPFDDVNSR
jgi:AbrB family looped-hinge helix DNA binding protein